MYYIMTYFVMKDGVYYNYKRGEDMKARYIRSMGRENSYQGETIRRESGCGCKDIKSGNGGANLAMSNADKMFLDSAVRRQELAMKDLFILADRYPGLVSSDILGGLYAINTLLQDARESVSYR